MQMSLLLRVLLKINHFKEIDHMHDRFKKAMAVVAAAAMTLLPATPVFADQDDFPTTTPIKHVVVIFQENVSFDHYFATYPFAANPAGEPAFHAAENTPTVNGLLQPGLATNNPNLNAANGAGASNPFRLDRSQAATADQDHNYADEQSAFHNGLMDLFPKFVGTAGPPPSAPPAAVTTKGLVMGWFDGNTVTAMWNYAQHFAMSDNSWGTTFGPSTPGALNLISGQTNGAINVSAAAASFAVVDGGNGSLSVINDGDPTGDVCSSSATLQMKGKNIGDLLSAAGVSWGFFEGGFDLTITNANGTTGCKRSSKSPFAKTNKVDYIPHHQPFQYYATTANPTHARPASIAEVGHDGPANHQYDTHDFFDAVKQGNFPAVSYIKAPGFQDGHAGYSSPLDEQTFVVNTINFLESRPEWNETAVLIVWDDSDGWYDHQMGPIVNTSTGPADNLTGPGTCGDGTTSLPGVDSGNAHALGRCGFGPRLPFLVVSPFAKRNFVDHMVTDQSSTLRFIEDNWLGGQRIGQGSFDGITNSITQMFDFDRHHDRDENGGVLFLDASTGQPIY
jgi:phospholipase C